VWLGNIATLRALPPGVDAVVSLCRVDDGDLPVGVEKVDVRLIDDDGPDANPNLELVLTDTVRLIEQLRNEEHGVLVHCVAAQSRTPTVAVLYGGRKKAVSGKTALQEVASVLSEAYPNNDFRRAYRDWKFDGLQRGCIQLTWRSPCGLMASSAWGKPGSSTRFSPRRVPRYVRCSVRDRLVPAGIGHVDSTLHYKT
jgi:hypothetical protein